MAEHIQINAVSPRIQYQASGSDTIFSYDFPIFEDADMQVYLGSTLQEVGFSVAGAGESDGGTVTFDTAPAVGTIVTLLRDVAMERTSDFQEAGALRAKTLNDELDRQTAMIQQLNNNMAFSVRRSYTGEDIVGLDLTLPEPESGKLLQWSSDGLSLANTTANAEDIASVSSSAAAASASANAAATSATQAELFASAAASTSSSPLYTRTETKTESFSVDAVLDPLVGDDDGVLFLCDTSAGAITITLPTGANAGPSFRLAFAKVTADSNPVTIQTQGSETVNGGAQWLLSSAHAHALLTLNTTPDPDTWFATGVGFSDQVGVLGLTEAARPYDIAFVAGFAASGEATDLKVQTPAIVSVPRAMEITGEVGSVSEAPVGAAVEVDIEKNGVSIYSVKPQIASGATTVTAGTLVVDPSVSAGDRLAFKVTQIGSSTAGGGLTLTLQGKLV